MSRSSLLLALASAALLASGLGVSLWPLPEVARFAVHDDVAAGTTAAGSTVSDGEGVKISPQTAAPSSSRHHFVPSLTASTMGRAAPAPGVAGHGELDPPPTAFNAAERPPISAETGRAVSVDAAPLRQGGPSAGRAIALSAQRADLGSPSAAPVAPMPAALAEPPPSLGLTQQQKATLEKLRHDFVAAVGGVNQDPANPEYARRWQEAQISSDQLFRLHFGEAAFVQMQIAALQHTGDSGNQEK